MKKEQAHDITSDQFPSREADLLPVPNDKDIRGKHAGDGSHNSAGGPVLPGILLVSLRSSRRGERSTHEGRLDADDDQDDNGKGKVGDLRVGLSKGFPG